MVRSAAPTDSQAYRCSDAAGSNFRPA
jgi:hypothetical protein